MEQEGEMKVGLIDVDGHNFKKCKDFKEYKP